MTTKLVNDPQKKRKTWGVVTFEGLEVFEECVKVRVSYVFSGLRVFYGTFRFTLAGVASSLFLIDPVYLSHSSKCFLPKAPQRAEKIGYGSPFFSVEFN